MTEMVSRIASVLSEHRDAGFEDQARLEWFVINGITMWVDRSPGFVSMESNQPGPEGKMGVIGPYQIARDERNLRNAPWAGAIGIEKDEGYAVPSLICWFSRGAEDDVARVVRLLNEDEARSG